MKTILCMALLAGFAATACAQTADDQSIFTQKVGEMTLTLLSEGPGRFPPSILLGATDQMLPADGKIPKSTNAFLVQTADRKVLIDAGTSNAKLLANLTAAGVKPGQIDQVLITHTHGDHIGGLLCDGKAAFPNATIRLSQREYEWWAGNPDSKTLFEAYAGRIEPFVVNQLETSELQPGFTAIGAFGHTPGHVCYLLGDGGGQLLVWGDVAHAMAVQMPYPTVSVTYDSDPDLARASRMHVLERYAARNIPVAGMHIAWPGMGYIGIDQQSHTLDAGYRFTPVR